MIDIALLVGRIALIALLYIFLLAAALIGVGRISGKKGVRGADTLSITIATGPDALVGTSLPLTATLVIGRAHGNDITVSDDLVSSTHARIAPLPEGGAMIEDLNSTNGTYVDGKRIGSPRKLKAGDRIGIGKLEMVVGRT